MFGIQDRIFTIRCMGRSGRRFSSVDMVVSWCLTGVYCGWRPDMAGGSALCSQQALALPSDEVLSGEGNHHA